MLETEDGHVLAAHGEAIGRATNNVAEYRGLVAGLEKALELGVRELSTRASRLARQIGRVRWTAVRREHNELADRLVNEALDAG